MFIISYFLNTNILSQLRMKPSQLQLHSVGPAWVRTYCIASDTITIGREWFAFSPKASLFIRHVNYTYSFHFFVWNAFPWFYINECSNNDKTMQWPPVVIAFRDLVLATLSATVLLHFSTQWQLLQYGRQFVVWSRLDCRMIWEKRQDLSSSGLCGLQELKAILVQVFYPQTNGHVNKWHAVTQVSHLDACCFIVLLLGLKVTYFIFGV